MGYALIALLLAGVIAVAYYSSKTWPIYQVVLVAFLFVASAAFVYLGAMTLTTHKNWQTLVENQKKEVQNLEQQIAPLRGGDGPNGVPVPGLIPQMKRDLERLVRERGGATFNAKVESVKEGVVQLTLPSTGHGLKPDMPLFVFDEKPFAEGGRYQGQFKVVSVGEESPEVKIAPALPLSAAAAKRLTAAEKGSWTLYTSMPVDNPAVFTSLDEQTRAALLPPQSQAEFANAERMLRDYEFLFHENYVQQSILNDNISKVAGNLQRIESAIKETNNEIAYRGTEKNNLKFDLEKFQYEAKAIGAYQQTLDQFFQQLRESLKSTYANNKQLAANLTASQLKAAEEINQRSGSTKTGAPSNAPATQDRPLRPTQ